ncbi:MAG: ABC transporter substrate-binding protein [Bryobacterales bacterium]|nr:ABC transporter substrate-binding protein [Bryobacterales bacterium]
MTRRRAILLAPLTAACARRGAETPIRIAPPAASIAHLPLTLAHSLGFFAEEGLDVRMEELRGASKVTEAVVGGSADVGGGSYQQTVQANAAGAGIQCFSVLCTQYTHILATAPGRTSPRRVADLKGKTAGVMNHGDSTQDVLHYLLLRHGMTPADVTTVAVGTGATAIAALENGREGVELASQYLPSTTKTVEALLAGSAEFATTGFDHLLNLAVSGKTLRSVVLIVNRDSRSLVVSPARSGIRTTKDLRGRSIGVPGLASSNHVFIQHVLAKHGLNWADASFAAISMGRPAVLAVERGVVDPAVLTVADWVEQNRDQVKRVARAFKRTLLWLQAHSADEEIRATLPPEFVTDDAALDMEVDVEVLRIFKMLYSADGVMPEHGPETLRKVLSLTQTDLRVANIDLSELYTNEFVAERP